MSENGMGESVVPVELRSRKTELQKLQESAHILINLEKERIKKIALGMFPDLYNNEFNLTQVVEGAIDHIIDDILKNEEKEVSKFIHDKVCRFKTYGSHVERQFHRELKRIRNEKQVGDIHRLAAGAYIQEVTPASLFEDLSGTLSRIRDVKHRGQLDLIINGLLEGKTIKMIGQEMGRSETTISRLYASLVRQYKGLGYLPASMPDSISEWKQSLVPLSEKGELEFKEARRVQTALDLTDLQRRLQQDDVELPPISDLLKQKVLLLIDYYLKKLSSGSSRQGTCGLSGVEITRCRRYIEEILKKRLPHRI